MNDDSGARRSGLIIALAISLPVLAVIIAGLVTAMARMFSR